MSATRDPSQKHTFVYSNLYQIYQKGKTAAKAAEVPAASPVLKPHDPSGIVTGKIIKADDANTGAGTLGLRITRHEPPRLLGKYLNSPATQRLGQHIHANRPSLPAVAETRRQALDGLRANLRSLQNLHERLRFMLREIEELTKK